MKRKNNFSGALIVSEIVSLEKNIKIPVIWTDDWKESGNVQLFDKEGRLVGETDNDVARFLARTVDFNLYGKKFINRSLFLDVDLFLL